MLPKETAFVFVEREEAKTILTPALNAKIGRMESSGLGFRNDKLCQVAAVDCSGMIFVFGGDQSTDFKCMSFGEEGLFLDNIPTRAKCLGQCKVDLF